MQLEWLGRYRNWVEKVIKFGNAYANSTQKEASYGTAVSFTPPQLQTMEYILENEEKRQSMAEIAARLGMSPSTFSKNAKKMIEKGLIEKYHTVSNRKTVIMRISPLGRKVYFAYCQRMKERTFDQMFEMLDGIPQEYLDRMTMAIERWADDVATKRLDPEEPELVKID